MQKALLYMGWTLAVLGVSGSAVLYGQLNALKSEHLALSNEMLTQTQVFKAQKELPPEPLATPVEEKPAPKESITALPDSFNLDKVVGDMVQDMSVEPDPETMSDKRGKRRQGEDQQQEDGNTRREEMKQRYMDRYKGLFEALGLNPERANALQDVLQTHAEKIFDIRRMEREGLITEEEAQAKLAALDAEMQSQLGSMLNPQEMAQYQDFEATAPERMMAHSLNRQIKDHSDMNPALRDRLVASFQDQLLNEPATADGSIPLDPFTRSNVAYARTLEQLSTELSPEEYAQAQAFMEERLRMQSAMAERMSTWGFDRGSGGRRNPNGEGKPRP